MAQYESSKDLQKDNHIEIIKKQQRQQEETTKNTKKLLVRLKEIFLKTTKKLQENYKESAKK